SRNRINALMSTSAKSLVPAATRAIASDDPLAMLIVTASPSAPNRPPAAAITNGAAAASIGRSSENWIWSGALGSSAARTLLAMKPAIAHSTAREAKRALRRERMALVLTARIEVTSARGGKIGRAHV